MKKALVETNQNNIFCDSHLVARRFKVKPKRVVEKILQIEAHLADFKGDNFVPLISTENRKYRGQEYTAYLMNRDFFMLLVPKFNTKASRKWQGIFLSQFNLMEKNLTIAATNRKNDLWFADREEKKLARRNITDAVKDFVNYALECDSKGANYYYNAFTNMAYSTLGVKFKTSDVRDTLDGKQLKTLGEIECKQAELLYECMAYGTPYKKIFKNVKKKLAKEFQVVEATH